MVATSKRISWYKELRYGTFVLYGRISFWVREVAVSSYLVELRVDYLELQQAARGSQELSALTVIYLGLHSYM
jgi:hypothetical protein